MVGCAAHQAIVQRIMAEHEQCGEHSQGDLAT
jgi:hypothetical protein